MFSQMSRAPGAWPSACWELTGFSCHEGAESQWRRAGPITQMVSTCCCRSCVLRVFFPTPSAYFSLCFRNCVPFSFSLVGCYLFLSVSGAYPFSPLFICLYDSFIYSYFIFIEILHLSSCFFGVIREFPLLPSFQGRPGCFLGRGVRGGLSAGIVRPPPPPQRRFPPALLRLAFSLGWCVGGQLAPSLWCGSSFSMKLTSFPLTFVVCFSLPALCVRLRAAPPGPPRTGTPAVHLTPPALRTSASTPCSATCADSGSLPFVPLPSPLGVSSPPLSPYALRGRGRGRLHIREAVPRCGRTPL